MSAKSKALAACIMFASRTTIDSLLLCDEEAPLPLHRLTRITLAVHDLASAVEFYRDFGLTHEGQGRFSTVDGGEQLRLVQERRRRLVELGIAVDDPDDLDRLSRSLERAGYHHIRTANAIELQDPGTKLKVTVEIAPRLAQPEVATPTMNGPAYVARPNERAAGAFRDDPVRPRRLGHVVLGSTDLEGSYRLFVDTIGFKISDEVGGRARFLRCSQDHHNLFLQAAPIDFLHHTSWEVDDVDEIGRGASTMLKKDPTRHVWGLGRHNVGSNFFWYLRDPSGNFAEYYSDLDVIVEDELWEPSVFDPAEHPIKAWGPRHPRGFFRPPTEAEQLAPEEFARGLHSG